mmetsp:Transcript_20977/g.32875  ORF Transcript_20977/g.32875 Transcript_20977/m.32875 type:complete len:279 (-) Transcript_20977:173-1009(-)
MGQDVCTDLLARGYKVRGLTRRAEDVKRAVVGTELAQVDWVKGNLNYNVSDVEGIMGGVKKVIFAPLLASRAGLDPTYLEQSGGAALFEDIEMNHHIYCDAVREIARLGAKQGMDKFVLVSSSNIATTSEKFVQSDGRAWKKIRVEPSLLNREVIEWKLRGEQYLRASGVPYTIIHAYSPPPRPWDDPDPKKYDIAILQDETVGGAMIRSDLAKVCVEALVRPSTKGVTFGAIDVSKDLSGDTLSLVQKVNKQFPNWKQSLDKLASDPTSRWAELRDK